MLDPLQEVCSRDSFMKRFSSKQACSTSTFQSKMSKNYTNIDLICFETITDLIMSLAVIISALSIAAVPWANSLVLLGIFLCLQGAADGTINIGTFPFFISYVFAIKNFK